MDFVFEPKDGPSIEVIRKQAAVLPQRDTVISKDDILNLRIELETGTLFNQERIVA